MIHLYFPKCPQRPHICIKECWQYRPRYYWIRCYWSGLNQCNNQSNNPLVINSQYYRIQFFFLHESFIWNHFKIRTHPVQIPYDVDTGGTETCITSHVSHLLSYYVKMVLLYCCPDCPHWRAHWNSTGWTIWAHWTVIKKCSLRTVTVSEHIEYCLNRQIISESQKFVYPTVLYMFRSHLLLIFVHKGEPQMWTPCQ